MQAAEQTHLALRKHLTEILAACVVEDHGAHLFARDLFKEIHKNIAPFLRQQQMGCILTNTVPYYHSIIQAPCPAVKHSADILQKM